MAKDPAFLFYPNDYLGGTTGMTLEEKGAYMELLVMQFNKGAFTKDQAKKLLNGHFEELWAVLTEKFTELEGKFFNARLEKERNRRNAFITKQTEIGKKGGRPPKNNPNETQPFPKTKPYIENEIINEDVLDSSTQKNFSQFPTHETYSELLTEMQIGAVQEFYKLTKQFDLSTEQINGFYKIFKVQNLTGKKYYADVGEVYSHFINWIKTQNISNGFNKKAFTDSAKPGTATDPI